MIERPITATRAWYSGPDASRPDHVVTILVQRNGEHIVSLDDGRACGCWADGFTMRDIPASHECDYLGRRFFGLGMQVSPRHALAYHKLYLDALAEVRAEIKRRETGAEGV